MRLQLTSIAPYSDATSVRTTQGALRWSEVALLDISADRKEVWNKDELSQREQDGEYPHGDPRAAVWLFINISHNQWQNIKWSIFSGLWMVDIFPLLKLWDETQDFNDDMRWSMKPLCSAGGYFHNEGLCPHFRIFSSYLEVDSPFGIWASNSRRWMCHSSSVVLCKQT